MEPSKSIQFSLITFVLPSLIYFTSKIRDDSSFIHFCYITSDLPNPLTCSWVCSENRLVAGGSLGLSFCSTRTKSSFSIRRRRLGPTNCRILGRPSCDNLNLWNIIFYMTCHTKLTKRVPGLDNILETYLKAHDIFLLSHRTKVFTPVLITFILSSFLITTSFTIGDTRYIFFFLPTWQRVRRHLESNPWRS